MRTTSNYHEFALGDRHGRLIIGGIAGREGAFILCRARRITATRSGTSTVLHAV